MIPIGDFAVLRNGTRARVMHADQCMAHTRDVPDVHMQAAARWLAGFAPVFLAVIIAAMVMLVYPYVTG